jgi:hypothetical protein
MAGPLRKETEAKKIKKPALRLGEGPDGLTLATNLIAQNRRRETPPIELTSG